MEAILETVIVVFMLFLCALCLFAVLVIVRDIITESSRRHQKNEENAAVTTMSAPAPVPVEPAPPVVLVQAPAPVVEEPVPVFVPEPIPVKEAVPVVEEPVAEELIAEEPIAEEPLVEEFIAECPIVEESPVEELNVEVVDEAIESPTEIQESPIVEDVASSPLSGRGVRGEADEPAPVVIGTHKQAINERRPAIPNDLFAAWFAENDAPQVE